MSNLSALSFRICHSVLRRSILRRFSLPTHDLGHVALDAVVVDGVADQVRQLDGLAVVEQVG